MIRKLLKAVGYVALAVLAAFSAAALYYRGTPAAELEAKWARPPSRFIDIDGVRVHYRDEGSGPVVALIHANYASLFMWEPWAAALKDRYRVVRFDMTAHGLTGPDPTRDYTLERTVSMFEDLLAALRIDRLTVAGTSLGGTVAIHFTARHPERVERLILLSPGSLEKDVRGRNTPANLPRVADLLIYVTPRALAKFVLTNGYGDKSKLNDAVIDEWYDMWMREGNRQAMIDRLRQYVSGDVDQVIRSVKVPVLLLWGEKNPRVPLELAYEFRKLLVSSPEVQLHVFRGVGHMAVQEAPGETSRVVREYLESAAPPISPGPSAAAEKRLNDRRTPAT
jgi:pimeloyl-ACP methyl ester carboxylesterase